MTPWMIARSCEGIKGLASLSAKIEVARRVLAALAQGHDVPTADAIQLRNWAVSTDNSVGTLEEIARHILVEEDQTI